MSKPKVSVIAGLIASSLLSAHDARADSTVSGSVQTFWVLSGISGAPGNGDFRVFLNGVSSFCPGAVDGTFAFVNANDVDFKPIMSAVELAYTMGKQISISTRLGTIAGGNYCQITYVSVSG